MKFTDEQVAFREAVRRMVAKEVAPIADEVDRNDRFPKELVQVYFDMGILQMRLPEEYGGAGASLVDACIAFEEVAKVSETAALMVAQGTISYILPLLYFGTEAQKRAYLPKMGAAPMLSAIAITEPQAGSDVGGMKTRAVRDGDDYVINGQKCYITFGAVADYVTVFAKTGEGRGTHNISAFLVDTKTKGFEIGKLDRKMGLNGIPDSPLFFDDMRVPAAMRLGEEGDGFKICMRCLDMNRPTIGAVAVGLAQGALDLAVDYAKNREAFGKTIADFQGMQFMLADMAMQVEAARCLVYEVARVADEGFADEAAFHRFAARASMAKCYASDMAMKVTTDAVQVFGGAGFMKDFPVERFMRDAKINQIFEGTNQIHRLIIARQLLGDGLAA